MGLLNSSLYYLWFIAHSNSRDFNIREIDSFPSPRVYIENEDFSKCISKLMEDFKRNKRRKQTKYAKTGNVEYDEYYPKLSKHIIDEIDTLLARHYGFTEEELDHIINYDIKYRMGIGSGGGGGDVDE